MNNCFVKLILLLFIITLYCHSCLVHTNPEEKTPITNTTKGVSDVILPETQNQEPKFKQHRLYSKKVAVLIGIDEYPNLPEKKQLHYAVRDAEGVFQILKRFGFTTIIRLYNKNASKQNILKALQGDLSIGGCLTVDQYCYKGINCEEKEDCVKIDKDSAVLIYFAGHGYTLHANDTELGYLIPYDGSMSNKEMDKNISMQLLKTDICPIIPAKHVLFILDACFGGLILANKRGTEEKPSNINEYLDYCTKHNVRQIIAAGGKDDKIIDGGSKNHSLLTHHLIEILKKVNDHITAKELGEEAIIKVRKNAELLGIKQTPIVDEIYGKGNFVFIAQTQNPLRKTQKKWTRKSSIFKRPRPDNNLIKLKEALDDIKKINDKILAVKNTYKNVRSEKYRLLSEEYQNRISKAERNKPRNYRFETSEAYQKRVNSQKAKVKELTEELSDRLKSIDRKYTDIINSEINKYVKQKNDYMNQSFVINASDGVLFLLDKYYPKKKQFDILIKFDQWMGFISGKISIPPDQAQFYSENPNLLTPEVILNLDVDGVVKAVYADFFHKNGVYHAKELMTANIVPTTIIQGPISGMEFLYIPPGNYLMGSHKAEPGKYDNELLHHQKIPDGFYIQTTEITQKQWVEIMGNNPSSFINCGENCPVEYVSWDDVQQFIEILNHIDATKRYRLPTEAEWEYACRSGLDTAYSWGDDVSCANMMHNNYLNNNDTSLCVDYIRNKKLPINSPAPVKSYLPNSWGLYDMHGNLWEWCSDAYENNNNFRVVKGGSWASEAKDCRSATRKRLEPDEKRSVVGFRLLMQQ